jgi:hypothetical protein
VEIFTALDSQDSFANHAGLQALKRRAKLMKSARRLRN